MLLKNAGLLTNTLKMMKKEKLQSLLTMGYVVSLTTMSEKSLHLLMTVASVKKLELCILVTMVTISELEIYGEKLPCMKNQFQFQ